MRRRQAEVGCRRSTSCMVYHPRCSLTRCFCLYLEYAKATQHSNVGTPRRTIQSHGKPKTAHAGNVTFPFESTLITSAQGWFLPLKNKTSIPTMPNENRTAKARHIRPTTLYVVIEDANNSSLPHYHPKSEWKREGPRSVVSYGNELRAS